MSSDVSSHTLVSPDGRFEVVRQATHDRFETLYDTVLIERATGERLLAFGGLPRTEFAAGGTLSVEASGYKPGGVQVDPARRVFRTGADDPWLPLAAWQALESAYQRGWADGLNFRSQDGVAVFPWVTTALLVGSILLLFVLGVQPFLDGVSRASLLALGGVGVLFFGWLAAGDLRAWAQLRILRRRIRTGA